MDHDDSPGLSVGFAVDTGGSFESLLRLERAMDATEGKLLPAAARIERATADMVNLERPSLQLTTFSSGATRALQAVNREKSQTTKIGERLVQQLEREAASLGKTKDEMRAAKVEAIALAASQQKNTDLADRLLSASRQRQFAANALAEEQAASADRAAKAMEREAQAVRSAAGAHQAFEAAARRGMAVYREQQSAQAAAAAETERLVVAGSRLRATIDPAFAAQQRFDREMGEARTLIAANVISLDEYVAKLRLERTALDASATASGKHGAASGQQRAATQQLGFQLNDVATQYASGTAASMIFAQQSGQVIQALQMMSTTGSGVLGFLASWQGAVVSAIVIAAIPFIAKLVETNNALDKDVEKLRKSAAETETTGRAKRVFANTLEGVTEALRRNQEALKQLNDEGKTAAVRALEEAIRAKSRLGQLRDEANAQLTLARAVLEVQQARAIQGGERGDVAAAGVSGRIAVITRLEAAITKSDAAIAKADGQINEALGRAVVERAKQLADPAERIKQIYEGRNGLIDLARRQATAEEVRNGTLNRQIKLLMAREQLELDAAQKLKSTAGRSSEEYGRSVSSSDAAAIARKAGMQVNSGDRTFASQKALYDRWVAAGRPSGNPVAKPGSSAHEFGNALDIQKTAGMTVQRIKDAFASEGVRLTKVFSEQGHWHVEWARSAEDVRAVGDAHRDAAASARELAKSEKDVFAWARKSADVMFESDTADAERRRFEEAKRTFKTIMGDADPFGDAVEAGHDALQAKWELQAQARVDQQERLNEHLRLTADLAAAAGDAMGNAFGEAGRSLGDVMTILARYGGEQERINQSQLSDADKRRASTALQLDSMLGLTGAAKSLFKEQTTGYRAIEAAEKALAVVRAISTVRDVAAGAAKMFASLGPFAFPAVAAMAAVMAGFGISVASSGKGPKAVAANDGMGTVLGDTSAKSESIKRAIDQLRDVDTLMLSHSREMAASLRSIDRQIGGFAAQILKAGDINASTGVTEGFKTDTTGKVLSHLIDPLGIMSKIPVIGGVFSAVKGIISSLFGSKTQITGTGLYGGAQSLGGILSGGFDAQNYTDVKKTKKFLGITTGTSYSTQYSGADAGLENQFTLILRSFNDAIAAAAGPLGESTDAIQQRLSGFVVNIGKIDLTGLTGEQITEKLTAIFGKAADEMAGAAFPGVAKYQKAGEGLFETAVRVSSTLETVGASLDLLAGGTRQLSMDAKLGIADQFDSLSALASAADGYFKAYYTSAEQAAGQTARFATVFDSLGMAMPDTLAGFRSLVEAQDLTTAAGQSTYATLLQLAPAFADLKSSMTGVKSAADIASERLDLERQMLELRGDTVAIRALDLAKLDVSNRALQQQVWAVQDAQKAADAADQLREAWTSVGDTIETEIDRIRGLSGTSSEGGFAVLQGRFNAASLAARGGDQDAAKLLPGLSQAMLAAAAQVATSRQELDRVQAMTASSLAATKAAIDAMSVAPSATSTAALLAAAANAQAVTTPTAAANDTAASIADLRDELAATRADLSAALVQIASNTGGIKRKLDDVTGQSGGDAISIVQAA